MPTVPINYVTDKEEEVFFPVTHENAVVDNNGVLLGTKIGDIELALDIIINGYTE